MAQHDYSARGIFWLLINGLVVVAMVLGLIGIGTIVRYSNAITPSRVIVVSAEGKVAAVPDLATYSFSVVSQGSDPDAIGRENTTRMNQAIAFVKQQGVAEADIKTTGYNLYPRYTYDKDTGRSRIDGYELTQTVTLKFRDLTKVGAVLAGLVKTGVNQATNLQYTIENPEALRAQARQQAFNAAFTKARSMAAQNGVHIARVINFSESMGYNPSPVYFEKAMSAGMGGSPTPDTQAGTEEVTVNVSVTYEIR